MKLSFTGDRRLAALVRCETVEGGTLLTVRPAVRPCAVTLLQAGGPGPLVVRLQGADRLCEVALSCTSELERELLDSTAALGWQLEDCAQWLLRGERPAPAGLLFAQDDLAAPRLEVLVSDRGGYYYYYIDEEDEDGERATVARLDPSQTDRTAERLADWLRGARRIEGMQRVLAALDEQGPLLRVQGDHDNQPIVRLHPDTTPREGQALADRLQKVQRSLQPGALATAEGLSARVTFDLQIAEPAALVAAAAASAALWGVPIQDWAKRRAGLGDDLLMVLCPSRILARIGTAIRDDLMDPPAELRRKAAGVEQRNQLLASCPIRNCVVAVGSAAPGNDLTEDGDLSLEDIPTQLARRALAPAYQMRAELAERIDMADGEQDECSAAAAPAASA
jgi:hypothetical protein